MAITLYRGDVVICSLSGDYGKPRPAIVIQADLFNPTHASITICPITSHVIDTPMFRLRLEPNKKNGIKTTSQIMIDKIMTIKREKISDKIGHISPSEIYSVDNALKSWLSL